MKTTCWTFDTPCVAFFSKDCPALVEVAFSSVLLYFIGEDFLVNGMSEDHLEDSTVRALSAISENLDPALEILETMTSGSLGLDLIAPCQGSSSGPAHKMARIELSAKVAMLHRLLNVTNGLLREPHSEFVVSIPTIFCSVNFTWLSNCAPLSQCIINSSKCLYSGRKGQEANTSCRKMDQCTGVNGNNGVEK